MTRVGARNTWAARPARTAPGMVGLALALMLGVSACRQATPRMHAEPSHLRVGIATIYPPMAFKENGQIVGVEADFAPQLATDLGVKVTLVELPWEELIPSLVGGRIDVIMSGMSITEARNKLVSFTQPYLRVGQMALIRRSDYTRLRDTATMNQPTSRVGFQTGTTGEDFVRRSLTQRRPDRLQLAGRRHRGTARRADRLLRVRRADDLACQRRRGTQGPGAHGTLPAAHRRVSRLGGP